MKTMGTTGIQGKGRSPKERTTLLRVLFVVSALWNLLGAGFGYFNTAYTFENFFGRELSDPLIYEIYQGAWGTTLVYFVGYMLVAWRPFKYSGIVIVGGIGKLGFAIKLLQLYSAGLAKPVVLIVVIGDLIFCALFVYYFFCLYQARKESDARRPSVRGAAGTASELPRTPSEMPG